MAETSPVIQHVKATQEAAAAIVRKIVERVQGKVEFDEMSESDALKWFRELKPVIPGLEAKEKDTGPAVIFNIDDSLVAMMGLRKPIPSYGKTPDIETVEVVDAPEPKYGSTDVSVHDEPLALTNEVEFKPPNSELFDVASLFSTDDQTTPEEAEYLRRKGYIE